MAIGLAPVANMLKMRSTSAAWLGLIARSPPDNIITVAPSASRIPCLDLPTQSTMGLQSQNP
jgi:hypothetical protein